jgi:hypothetical protein
VKELCLVAVPSLQVGTGRLHLGLLRFGLLTPSTPQVLLRFVLGTHWRATLVILSLPREMLVQELEMCWLHLVTPPEWVVAVFKWSEAPQPVLLAEKFVFKLGVEAMVGLCRCQLAVERARPAEVWVFQVVTPNFHLVAMFGCQEACPEMPLPHQLPCCCLVHESWVRKEALCPLLLVLARLVEVTLPSDLVPPRVEWAEVLLCRPAQGHAPVRQPYPVGTPWNQVAVFQYLPADRRMVQLEQCPSVQATGHPQEALTLLQVMPCWWKALMLAFELDPRRDPTYPAAI